MRTNIFGAMLILSASALLFHLSWFYVFQLCELLDSPLYFYASSIAICIPLEGE